MASDEGQKNIPGIISRGKSSIVPHSDLLGLNLVKPQLTESRRVAIGKKSDQVRQKSGGGGTWRAPVKLDFFRVTLLERDEKDDYLVDRDFHKRFGDKPREIPIELIFDRIGLNAAVYLGLYQSRVAFCKGNGEVASRLVEKGKSDRKQVDCPCPFLEERKCKRHLIFQFKLPGMGIGEVAKFRSTGFYTISSILGGLCHLKETVAMLLGCAFDEAPIAGVPLLMKYQKRTIVSKDQKNHTIPLVNVSYDGSESELYQIVKKRQDFLQNTSRYVQQLELEQKKALELLEPESVKEVAAITEEFHPDQADEDLPTEKGSKAKGKDDLTKITEGAKKALEHTATPSMKKVMAPVEPEPEELFDEDLPPEHEENQRGKGDEAAPTVEDDDWL